MHSNIFPIFLSFFIYQTNIWEKILLVINKMLKSTTPLHILQYYHYVTFGCINTFPHSHSHNNSMKGTMNEKINELFDKWTAQLLPISKR